MDQDFYKQLMSELQPQIELMKQGQPTNPIIYHEKLIKIYGRNPQLLDIHIQNCQKILLQRLSATQTAFMILLVDVFGISIVLRSSLQNYLKTMSEHQDILSISYQLLLLCHFIIKKFTPINDNFKAIELKSIQYVFDILQKLEKDKQLDQVKLDVKQSYTDGFYVQVHLIFKQALKKYDTIKKKEDQEQKLGKLQTIIEEDLQESNELEDDEVISQILQQSGKLSGNQIEYEEYQDISVSGQIQKDQKIKCYMQIDNLKTSILKYLNNSKLTILEYQLILMLKKKIDQSLLQIQNSNIDIIQEIAQLLAQKRVHQAFSAKEQQQFQQDLFDREAFQLNEYLQAIDNNQIDYKMISYPIKSAHLQDQILSIICAYLNGKGGLLHLGISDDGQVRGIQMDSNARKNFTNFLYQLSSKIYPKIDLVKAKELSIDFLPIQSKFNELIPELVVARILVQQGQFLNYFYTFQNSQNNVVGYYMNIRNVLEIKYPFVMEEQVKISQNLKQKAQRILVKQRKQDLVDLPKQENVEEQQKMVSSFHKMKKAEIDMQGSINQFNRQIYQYQQENSPKQEEVEQYIINITFTNDCQNNSQIKVVQNDFKDSQFNIFDVSQYKLKISSNGKCLEIITSNQKQFQQMCQFIQEKKLIVFQNQEISVITANFESIYRKLDMIRNSPQKKQMEDIESFVLIGFQQDQKKKIIEVVFKILSQNGIQIQKCEEYGFSVFIHINKNQKQQFYNCLSMNFQFGQQIFLGVYNNQLEVKQISDNLLNKLITQYQIMKQSSSYIIQSQNQQSIAQLFDNLRQLRQEQKNRNDKNIIEVIWNLKDAIKLK